MLKMLNSKYFWQGVGDAFAAPALSVVAFLGVWRRAMKGDFPAVEYDAKSLWWTHDEQRARQRAALDKMLDEWERLD